MATLGDSMAKVPLRLDVLNLPAKHKDLLVQALTELQANSFWQDKSSFFQLGGIHGWPNALYDDVAPLIPGQDRPDTNGRKTRGYCTHASELFPTWHRAYLLALEKALTDSAKRIAVRYPAQERAEYIAAAQELRLPYWDWLNYATVEQRQPSFLWKSLITINTPSGMATVNNPFKKFTFPDAKGLNINPVGVNPSVRLGASTGREKSDWLHNNLRLSSGGIPDLKKMKASMLETKYGPGDWNLVSNKARNESLAQEAADTARVGAEAYQLSHEIMHDQIHVLVGGFGHADTKWPTGHMTNPQTAGFDPIFWLHHCNVDRIIAEWQMVHRDVWLPSPDPARSGMITDQTELRPFYHPNPGQNGQKRFFTSGDVRWTWQGPYPYAYDLTDTEAARKMRPQIDALMPPAVI